MFLKNMYALQCITNFYKLSLFYNAMRFYSANYHFPELINEIRKKVIRMCTLTSSALLSVLVV